MGFWSFLKRSPGDPAKQRASEDSASTGGSVPTTRDLALKKEEGSAASALHKLARVGASGGPTDEEALALFAHVRTTPDEAQAIADWMCAADQARLPEALLVALGTALVDRGELEEAARALARATSPAARMILCDLAARRGDLPAAISFVERVLVRDLDHPGARERHRSWRSALGYEAPTKTVSAGATAVCREADAPFDLLHEVGRGGAAVVYEAVDRELGRHVALKVYHHPDRAQNQLAHEARVAVALEGTGVVRVFDLDPDHGWIALEWAMFGTLRDALRNREFGRLLPIARWAHPLAVALARVHALGWVHHDVKPANVLLSRTFQSILTDFGIAQRAGEPSPPGSLGYLSKERLAGRRSDPRDDVYGFGRVLEDVLDAVPVDGTSARLRLLATACLGADSERPANGRALLSELEKLDAK